MGIEFKRKLRGLWHSRTHWAGALLGILVGATPQIERLLQIKLTADDYAIAGVMLYGSISFLRWITTQPLEEKVDDR
jgi:hypothetical protein